jgi:hypothetical protein
MHQIRVILLMNEAGPTLRAHILLCLAYEYQASLVLKRAAVAFVR